MLITVATNDGKSSQLEVGADTTVATVRDLAAAELGVQTSSVIVFNGKPLADANTLNEAGVGNEDLLLVDSGGSDGSSAGEMGASAGPSLSDIKSLEPNNLLKFFKEHPQLLRQMHHVNAKLAEAVETGDVQKISMCVMMQQMDSHKTKWTQDKERAALFANPDSEENQAKIQRMIEQEAIDQNYHMAMEEAPEVFARVSMLYIDTEINGVGVKAFVDSGAQSTIMSARCAERCGLMRLVDRRFHGEARGVGTGKILGRIHMAQIKIGQHFFPCSFTILEASDVDFLFGLDMLKRHLCIIDLKTGSLGLGSAGATVPFLTEKDLPSSARETQAPDLDGQKPSAAGLTRGTSGTPVSIAESSGNTTAATTAATTTTGAIAAEAAAAPVSRTGGETASASSATEEAKVLQLVAMGFPRQQVEDVLKTTSGNAEEAAALLFAQMET